MSYFINGDPILCPFCKKEYTDAGLQNGEDIEVQCECGKKYTIHPIISYDYSTKCGGAYEGACEYIRHKMIMSDEPDEPKVIGGTLMMYAICIHCKETCWVKPEEITVKGAMYG